VVPHFHALPFGTSFQVLHFQSTRSNAQRTSERPLTAEAEQFEEDGMGV